MKILTVKQVRALFIFVILVCIGGGAGIAYGNICQVGDVLAPGESCTYPGTDIAFSVLDNGSGRFLFFTAGTGINARNVTLNGVKYNFAASKRADGKWEIEASGYGTTPAKESETDKHPDTDKQPVEAVPATVAPVTPDEPPQPPPTDKPPETEGHPDLVIETVEAVPATVAPGRPFRLYMTLKNQGTAASTATTLRYYRSSDDTLSTADTELGKADRAPLAPKGVIRRYLTVTAPTSPGTYAYGACVESVPGETDTANNCSTAVSVTVTPSGTPTPPPGTRVQIQPASLAAPAVKEQIELAINIVDAEAVAGYQATVQFDTTALRYISSANGDFLPPGAFFVKPVVEGNLVKLSAASFVGERNGNGTLATLIFEGLESKASTLTLQDVLLSNKKGTSFQPRSQGAEITQPERRKEDVNTDGAVDITDLAAVAASLGTTGEHPADVNGDELVNVADLVLVAGALGTAAAPAATLSNALDALTFDEVQHSVAQAHHLNLRDPNARRGIARLEQLLAAWIPKETALLANYPNPFNPETWIPYQLAKDAEVTLTIYELNGQVVRRLALGHKPAGVYQDRSRAVYWDGRNALGEQVASGIYFYQLETDEISLLRKMVILQ